MGVFPGRHLLEIIRTQSPVASVAMQTPDTPCSCLLAWIEEFTSVLAVDTPGGSASQVQVATTQRYRKQDVPFKFALRLLIPGVGLAIPRGCHDRNGHFGSR